MYLTSEQRLPCEIPTLPQNAQQWYVRGKQKQRLGNIRKNSSNETELKWILTFNPRSIGKSHNRFFFLVTWAQSRATWNQFKKKLINFEDQLPIFLVGWAWAQELPQTTEILWISLEKEANYCKLRRSFIKQKSLSAALKSLRDALRKINFLGRGGEHWLHPSKWTGEMIQLHHFQSVSPRHSFKA